MKLTKQRLKEIISEEVKEAASSSTMNKLKNADMTQDIEDILDKYNLWPTIYSAITKGNLN